MPSLRVWLKTTHVTTLSMYDTCLYYHVQIKVVFK